MSIDTSPQTQGIVRGYYQVACLGIERSLRQEIIAAASSHNAAQVLANRAMSPSAASPAPATTMSNDFAENIESGSAVSNITPSVVGVGADDAIQSSVGVTPTQPDEKAEQSQDVKPETVENEDPIDGNTYHPKVRHVNTFGGFELSPFGTLAVRKKPLKEMYSM